MSVEQAGIEPACAPCNASVYACSCRGRLGQARPARQRASACLDNCRRQPVWSPSVTSQARASLDRRLRSGPMRPHTACGLCRCRDLRGAACAVVRKLLDVVVVVARYGVVGFGRSDQLHAKLTVTGTSNPVLPLSLPTTPCRRRAGKCRRWDSNPQKPVPKTGASATSATAVHRTPGETTCPPH